MRVFYTCLFYLSVPAIVLRLLLRSINAPDYRQRWLERFAFYPKGLPDVDIWFHAVSVGEAEALFPLVQRILQRHPKIRLLITTTTPTGSARVKAVLQENVAHVYLPYDLPDAISRFMRQFKPRLAVIMETEIWPNLYAFCGKNTIPLYIINARLSEKSTRNYRKIPGLARQSLAQARCIATQSQEDSNRFVAIGASVSRVITSGNIKFDVDVSPELIVQGLQLRASMFTGRFVWVIASTHQGEEALLLDGYWGIKQRIPNLLLVIAPRHPERFAVVKKLCEQKQLKVATRTAGETCNQDTDVYLLDTLGELKLFYAAADVAFVGGSLVPAGGHNILEAAAIGVPVVFGPYMGNFNDIAHGILQKNAAIQCQDNGDVFRAIYRLYTEADYRKKLIENAKAFISQNQGVIDRLFGMLEQHIKPD